MIKYIKKLINKSNYVEKNIMINQKNFWERPPRIFDATLKQERFVKWIIQNKSQDINCREVGTGNTALHHVAENCIELIDGHGYREIARNLLEAGADPFIENDMGITALDAAFINGNNEMAKLIKSYMDKGKEK